MSTGKRRYQAPAAVAAVLLAILWLSAIPATANGKKLQVIQDKAAVRLEATERSAVVETLGRGAVLTLGSDVRTKVNWYYVYFTSLQSGNTRAGYIHESCVRKLFPTLRVIEIQSGDEILNPTEIDLDSPFQPNLKWGSTKADIVRTEGRPQGEDMSQGLAVLRYKRELMKKKCEIEYLLDGNKLVGARCRLMENYADKNRYVEDYNRLRDFLTAKVGSPALRPRGLAGPFLRELERLLGDRPQPGPCGVFVAVGFPGHRGSPHPGGGEQSRHPGR